MAQLSNFKVASLALFKYICDRSILKMRFK